MSSNSVYGIAVVILLFASPAASQTNYSSESELLAGFGGAVAVGEQGAFIGSAPVGWQTGAEPPGVVYQYARNEDGEWTEKARIQASDGEVGDDFGRSVFVQASFLIVGAPGVQAAYVFEENQDGSWSETGKLEPSLILEGAEFGGAYARGGLRNGNMAMVGERIVVTSYSSSANSGAVHVFRKSDMNWEEESILMVDDPEDGDRFAWTVAASDDNVFVGAGRAEEGMGVVYVFARENGIWTQQGRLSSDDSTRPAAFGTAMAVNGRRLIVSAPARYVSGVVYVFEQAVNGRVWEQTHRIEPPTPSNESEAVRGFGSELALSVDHLLIGSSGKAFVYDFSDLSANPAMLEAQDVRTRSGFGTGLGIHSNALIVGSPSADYGSGLATLYEKDSQSSEWHPLRTLESEIPHLESISGDQIDCEEGVAALFDCNNVDLVSFLSLQEISTERGVKMNDIWGWEDSETGKEWVLQGRTEGVSFVDISDPGYPVFVGQILKTKGSPGASWRDVKVYSDHAFIVADGSEAHGVQIFDLRQLRDVNPVDMPVTFEETAHYSGVNSTHNIVINEETGFAYAVGNRAGGETCGGQVHIINIQDPVNPQFAGCFTHEGERGTHDAQCVIYRGADSDYYGREVCFNSNGSAFIIADVTDKENTSTIAISDYPNVNFTHQGWLTEDHNYFYMNDELDEMNAAVSRTRTLIWDIQDLDDPNLVREFYLDSGASDHNLYVRDNFLYESNYQAGLRVLDISDPLNPVEVGHFDTAPYAGDEPGFGGSWSNYPYFKSGIIAVSSRKEGLFLLRKREVDL